MTSDSSPVRLPLRIAVTGHRDLVDTEVPQLREAARDCLQKLIERYPDRQIQLLTALASGADQLAADAALELGCDIIAVLPMKRSIYQTDFTETGELAAFEQRMNAAIDVIELPATGGAATEDLATHGAVRDRQYARLGTFLAAHCHLLMAIWDGKESGKIGGTGAVVRFHHDDLMPGFTDPVFATQQMLIDDESDLVFHIVCSRARTDGAPANGLQPLSTHWFSKDLDNPYDDNIPSQHETIFAHSAEFSRDQIKHAQRIKDSAYPLFEVEREASLPPGASEINRWFCAADVLAIYFQKKVIRTLRVMHVLAFLMGICFILYADVQTERIYLIAFLGFFAVSAGWQWVGNKNAWHRKYLDYRALAEGLRVQFYWAVSGVEDEVGYKFAHDNFLRSQEAELGWIRNVMRVAGLKANASNAHSAEGMLFVLRDWIGSDGQGQLSFFRRRTDERIKRHRLTERLGQASLFVSVALVIVLVFADGRIGDDWTGPLLAMMGALLLVFGIRQGYAYALAEEELIKQYRFMLNLFRNAELRLQSATNDEERRQILRALGRGALDEHSEWLMMNRSRAVKKSKIWRMGN